MFAEMISDETRARLQDIIRGDGPKGSGDRISTIRSVLFKSFGPGRTSQKNFESKSVIKKEEDRFLREFAHSNNLWFDGLPAEIKYLARGGESKVFFAEQGSDVLKVNSGAYYATWTEFFNSLALHNLLFYPTAYTLVGLIDDTNTAGCESGLSMILKQPFIDGTQASLDHVKDYLNFNNFELLKRQDYINHEFGILLEDMHDENVISSNGLLFFIDTVFYIME